MWKNCLGQENLQFATTIKLFTRRSPWIYNHKSYIIYCHTVYFATLTQSLHARFITFLYYVILHVVWQNNVYKHGMSCQPVFPGKHISASSVTNFLHIYQGTYLPSFIYIGKLLRDL
jgi:hypothetical protein